MKKKCPCCGFNTIEAEDEVITEICDVCFWQYDIIAHQNPKKAIGANGVSLNDARENYRIYGACKREYVDKKMVRQPLDNEFRLEGALDKLTIYQYLDKIVGQPIRMLGRTSNMLWIGIGEAVKTKNSNGKLVEKSMYALHVQTMWRIVNKEEKKILLASSDFYSPKGGSDSTAEFDWEQQGNNLFDEKSNEWMNSTKSVYIKGYKVNIWGDLLLLFSNNERLEVFVDASDDTECWRLLKIGDKEPHLVVTGLGVSFD